MRTIELLAPAKNYKYGCAAVDCGADALYVGAPGFGARVDAAVSVGDIARLCDYAHRFGVRVFVTMNTLVFADELREAERIAREVCRAGADALIVQDTAFLRMDLPPVELHASTQMCTMTPDRARFWSDAGFSRIILERAATLAEIRGIADAVPDTGIEAFVHGAICVAYSGQCYLSRSMSPRSGNRGACLQACRLPYDLVDENGKRLMSGKHLLSLRDLNLSQHLDDMANAGVSSFKIEGRLKDINYVRNVVGWYRNRLDGLIAGRSDLRRASQGVSALDFSPDPRKSFSRGATSYYINGASRGAASFDTPKSFGEPVGKATRVARDFVEGAGLGVLAAGDGVCFAGPDGGLVGTRVNRVEGDRIFLNRPGGIRAGTALFRNYDRRFVAALNRARTRRRIQVAAYVSVGPQRLALTLDDGRVSAGCSVDGDFAAAHNPSQAEETIRTQISKTGDTIYAVSGVEIRCDEPRFVPVAVLNALRRTCIEKLDGNRSAAYPGPVRRPENRQAVFPQTALTGADNVTNPLAERFYREHGVETVEAGYDLNDRFDGVRVMRMRYCLRREIGQCLRERPDYRGRLFIETGRSRYELMFDCKRCEMSVVCCNRTE